MTEKNIFAYKLFLSLNIPDFNLFFMSKLQPPPEKSCLFPSNPLEKFRSCQAPLFENLFGGSTPSPLQKGGVHNMLLFTVSTNKSNLFLTEFMFNWVHHNLFTFLSLGFLKLVSTIFLTFIIHLI